MDLLKKFFRMRKIAKLNSTGEIPLELFRSLKTFFVKYPMYEKHKSNIVHRLTRKKLPYIADNFQLFRLPVE